MYESNTCPIDTYTSNRAGTGGRSDPSSNTRIRNRSGIGAKSDASPKGYHHVQGYAHAHKRSINVYVQAYAHTHKRSINVYVQAYAHTHKRSINVYVQGYAHTNKRSINVYVKGYAHKHGLVCMHRGIHTHSHTNIAFMCMPTYSQTLTRTFYLTVNVIPFTCHAPNMSDGASFSRIYDLPNALLDRAHGCLHTDFFLPYIRLAECITR